jgi:hypothetical protein
MKCVQDKADLQTHRVSDRDASAKVKSGRYEYASRNLWKLQGRRK